MWQLDNRTPFAAERAWTRDRDGAEVWLVAVKATFVIRPDGQLEIAAEQPGVTRAPQYIDPDKPAMSSMKYDVDLVRTKTTTDVIVIGHAYAPKGKPVTELEIGLRVGPIGKRLRVVGDRVWSKGTISSPQPFSKMPIVYERAYGGFDPQSIDTPTPQWDERNPLGTGFAQSEAGIEGMRLPNFEYPDRPVRRWNERREPAGLGPICAHWQPRAKLAGTYDDEWQAQRFPLLPHDFDDRHYQCAQADQQAPQFLRGGETVALVNLTPAGNLEFELPRVFLGFDTFFFTGARQTHEKPKLHTVILEPDIPRVSLVWHTALPCHTQVYKLKQTRIIEKQLLEATAADAAS